LPELPEVETVCRGLNRLTLGQTIKGGEVLLQPTLAYPFSVREFWCSIDGTQIQLWQRRGKYLLANLSRSPSESAGWLGVHLRMTGQLLWLDRDVPLQKHTRVRLFFGDRHELRFVDTRTFGKFWCLPPTETPEKIITGLQHLGPEPFSEEFSPAYLASKLQRSNRNIKSSLLDQGLVAGIGNIYADEALFKSRIAPETIAANLSFDRIKRLHGAIIDVLQAAIDSGGTTFSDFLQVTGVNGNYGGIAWVYRRAGQPCRVCDTSIERIKLGGRSTHFCPQCQNRG
jgi:formamidopyrimidine-DNA glycosylase